MRAFADMTALEVWYARADTDVADFAEAYADQNERDYAELLRAVEAGEIAVERGV